MSTDLERGDLERRLRDALHQDAERARLVNPDQPADAVPLLLSTSEPTRLSMRRIVAVAAAIVLIAAVTVALIQNREPTPEEIPAAGLNDVFDDLTLGDAAVFTDIPPGRTVDLPPAPISRREPAAQVWTGRELIVWGGHDAESAGLVDGAAFDLETGTWRVIAPAPIEPRDAAFALWTGTEMVLWGGSKVPGGSFAADGAAYNPSTDTWRTLSEAPFRFATGAVWTGEEMIVLGDYQMAAYDPETDEWRQLADPPSGTTGAVSSGDTFLAVRYPSPSDVDYPTGDMSDFPVELERYDLSRDTWQPVHDIVVSDTILDITDPDGLTRAVLVLGRDPGAPVTVLDPAGNVVGTLPDVPPHVAAIDPKWTGEEVLFAPMGMDSEPWALNLANQSWRRLSVDEVPPTFGETVAAEAGVIIRWDGLEGPGSGIYRPPTPAGD